MLIEADAGTTASTVLSMNAKAKDGERRLPSAKAIYPGRQTEELASRPPLRNLWVSFFLMFSIYFLYT